jgi:alpha-1,3-rhamnosyl/mannosyltransferase
VLFTIHDLMPLVNPDWVTRYERIRYARSFKQAADQAELLIADSHKTAREIPEILGVEESRIRVVHLGVDPAFWRPVDRSSIEQICRRYDLLPGRYFVVLGTVSARKNLQVVVDALAEVKNQLDYPVIAVGPRGLGIDAIEDRIERLGLRQQVRLPGWLAESDLLALLRGSTALLHPSRDEGFGLTPLEGMAAGVPVAASNSGAIPEVTADAAVLIDPDDVGGWSNTMLRLARDDELRNEMIARGGSRARLFTWERTANDTIAVHRELLSGINPVYR